MLLTGSLARKFSIGTIPSKGTGVLFMFSAILVLRNIVY